MSKWYVPIEEREGKPIEQIIKEAYEEFGVGYLVADHFGISKGTLTYTLLKLGLKQKTIVVFEDTNDKDKSA